MLLTYDTRAPRSFMLSWPSSRTLHVEFKVFIFYTAFCEQFTEMHSDNAHSGLVASWKKNVSSGGKNLLTIAIVLITLQTSIDATDGKKARDESRVSEDTKRCLYWC